MGGYQVHSLGKREPPATALPVQNRNHQLRGHGPDESNTDRDKYEQRKTDPKFDTRLCLITPG